MKKGAWKEWGCRGYNLLRSAIMPSITALLQKASTNAVDWGRTGAVQEFKKRSIGSMPSLVVRF